MTLRLVPCTVKSARAWVKRLHRHLPDVQGGLFAVAAVDDSSAIRAVAIAGLPARVWLGTGRIVISRVASDGAANACSLLYGSLCRAAKALGYTEAWTYTLPEEPGTSLRAAGFSDQGLTDGGEWDRPSRQRSIARRPEPKRRWLRKLNASAPECAPPSAPAHRAIAGVPAETAREVARTEAREQSAVPHEAIRRYNAFDSIRDNASASQFDANGESALRQALLNILEIVDERRAGRG